MGRVRTKRPVVLPGWLTAATAAIADAPDDTALEAALATFGPPYGFERAEERSLYSWVDVLNRLDDVLERYALASSTVVATLTRPLGREAAGGAGAAGDPPSAGASPPGGGGAPGGAPGGGSLPATPSEGVPASPAPPGGVAAAPTAGTLAAAGAPPVAAAAAMARGSGAAGPPVADADGIDGSAAASSPPPPPLPPLRPSRRTGWQTWRLPPP